VALNSALFSQTKSNWINRINSLNRRTRHYRYPNRQNFDPKFKKFLVVADNRIINFDNSLETLMKKAIPNQQTPKDPAGNRIFDGKPIPTSENHRQADSIAALAGGIAHDYNNLLTAIIGNITLAQTYLNPDEKPFRPLQQALAASQAARNLTRKLIFFSKGGTPNRTITSVERLVKNVVDFTLSGSNIKCTYNVVPNPWRINVDQSQIGQALHNVVMNAREAMPDGGHIVAAVDNVQLTRQISTLPAGNYVRISITDHGGGIPEAEIDKIFTPYFSTKSIGDQKATGLGLSICHSIFKKHGGEVTVSSQTGDGTTLDLYLPAVQAEIPAKLSVMEPESPGAIFGEGKILVMDDEAMIRELAGEILQHLGYRVEFAKDGAEAVACYAAALKSTDPFDAVILDLTVRGGMGGEEAIQKLMAIDPNVKGIVSSGYSEDPEMTGFKEHGFCGAVAKPYTLEELGSKLGEVLRVKQI
jgi:signal transduction histidine kinase